MRKHLSTLAAILLGVSTSFLGSSCIIVKPEIHSSSYTSRHSEKQDVTPFNFSSKRELIEALRDWENGQIKKGYWSGLKLRTYNVNYKSLLEKIASEPSSSVDTFLEGIKNRYPAFDNLHPLKKAQLIYDTMRISFKSKINPYDKIKFNSSYFGSSDLSNKFSKIKYGFKQPYQTPEETFKFKGGICINLSTLLYNMYTRAGINCSLIFQDNVVGYDHMILTFEAFRGVFLPIDPSQTSKDFIRNISTTQQTLKGNNIKDFSFTKPELKKELLNLTDYL